MSEINTVELRWILSVIQRAWKLIAGLTLLAAVIAIIVTSVLPPVYRANVMLFVNPSKNSNTNQYNDLMAGAQLAQTYSQMLKDRPVLETVILTLGLKESPDSLAEQITAEPLHNSQIIQLTVSDSDPERAALIANSLAQAFTKRVEELSTMRYAGAIQNAQDRTEDLKTQIKDIQEQIDTQRTQKVTRDVALANSRTQLTTLQNDYQSLQNSYQATLLQLTEITGKVYVVEPVRVQKSLLKNTQIATAVVSIGQIQSTSGNTLGTDRLALTYGQLIVQSPLMNEMVDELDLTDTPDQLSKKISFDLVTGTQLIRFQVEDPDETKSRLIAQLLIEKFVAKVKDILSEPYSDRLSSLQKQIVDLDGSIGDVQSDIGILTSEIAQLEADLDRLETDLTAIRSDYRASLQNYEDIQTTAAETSDSVIVTEPAEAPKQPSQHRMLYVVIAALLGSVAGTTLAFVQNYFQGKIINDRDVRNAIDMSVLSVIGQHPMTNNELVMVSSPASLIAEDFRVLANKILLITLNSSVKTLMVTSPQPSEGKSMLVSNLAIGLSRMGLKVVVIDADLRLPRQHNLFKLSQSKGLTNFLASEKSNGVLQPSGLGDLYIVSSGNVPSNPAEILSSQKMSEFLQNIQQDKDLVLIDCPPVLAASDASILASKVDAVLLVLRAGVSESETAREAVEALHQAKANLVGVVLNSAQSRKKSSYYRYA